MIKLPVLSNEIFLLNSPNINICHRIVIEPAVNKNQIENALEKIGIRHPLLKCSIETDNNNKKWFVQNVDSMAVEYYQSTEMDWQKWYNKTDNIPFDFAHGPLVKFCVIFGSNTEIIILCHHIIGDGVAVINMETDLLAALDNNIDSRPIIPSLDPEDRHFKKTIPLDNQTKLYTAEMNNEWRKNRVQFSENDYSVFFKKYRETYRPNFYLASIEGNIYETLLENCRANRLTVNELLTAAFSGAILEISKYYSKNEIRIGIAINIRDEIVSQPLSCMGNYVSGMYVKIKYNPADCFLSNAAEISKIIKEHVTDIQKRHFALHFLNELDKELIQSVMFAAYGGFNHPVSKKLADVMGERIANKGIGITNLGRYTLNDYNNFKVMDIQAIGPAFPAHFLTIDIITVNNKMHFCIRYNEAEIETDVVKRIYEKALVLVTEAL